MSEESDCYLGSIESTFGVITQEHDPSIVTKELGVTPTKLRKKGEYSYSEFSPEPAVAKYGIWQVTKTTIGEELDLVEHLCFFKDLLAHKHEQVEHLRDKYSFEFVFYVLMTTEDTVGGFDLLSEDLAFLRNLCDRFTFRFCTNLQKECFSLNEHVKEVV